MNWAVYWFMFPACIVIASIAMLSGISGAAMLSPTLILVFPLLGVPSLTPAAAIGMSLFTEFFGFASGVAGYARRCLIDYQIARQMILVAVPFAAVGALASAYLNPVLLKTIYGVLMFVLAGVLVRQSYAHPTSYPAALETTPSKDRGEFRTEGDTHVYATRSKVYRYQPSGLEISRALTAGGGVLSGMLSTGIGEIELPQLVGLCRLPLPIAAGTSVLIVTAAVAAGSVTHLVRLISEGGLSAVPWNLIIYTVPGALIGGQIGARLQGTVREAIMERAMAGLFVLIGAAFLASVWLR
jgi:uncharacterized membrane protein YfcA